MVVFEEISPAVLHLGVHGFMHLTIELVNNLVGYMIVFALDVWSMHMCLHIT